MSETSNDLVLLVLLAVFFAYELVGLFGILLLVLAALPWVCPPAAIALCIVCIAADWAQSKVDWGRFSVWAKWVARRVKRGRTGV
jgi:hypothetical protein